MIKRRKEMTVKDLEIQRNVGVRPTGNVTFNNYVWLVDKGQMYDIVYFGIEECPRLRHWLKVVCVPSGYPEEKCKRLAEILANHITDKDIKEVNDMLDDFAMYGCD